MRDLAAACKATARGVAWVLCGLVATAHAAEGPEDQIVTDRPDFVESSVTVGKGRFQLETSVAGIHNRDGTLHQDILGTPTLLRFGVADTWELRLETDGYTRQRTDDTSAPPAQTVYGFADSELGVKWHMQDREGARPSVAWLLHVGFPSGSESLRGPGIRPSLRATMEWDLPSDSSIGVMPGVIYQSRDDGHRYAAGLIGVSFGHNWTEQLHTFLEIAAPQLARPVDGGNIVTYDFGFSYLITPKVQVDTGVFIGANHHTPDVAWTVGLSAKF
jgi:hypothetical protein